jgi:hypothetical protein
MNPPASRVLILGFHDGATDGVIEFGPGRVFRFDWADDSPELCGDPDRTFHFRRLPADALDRLAAVIEVFHAPGWPVWLPDWSFPTAADRDTVNAAVNAILGEAGDRVASVTTTDTVGFQTYSWMPAP